MSGLITVATAPGTWGIEPVSDPHQAPWQLVLDEVALAGFDGIELGPLGYLPTDPKLLSAELGARDLTLAGGFVMEPFHDAEQTSRIIRYVERTCALLAAAEAQILVVIGSLVPERSATAGRPEAAPPLAGVYRAVFIRTLAEVVRLAREHGLRPALHPHAGTYVEYEDEIDAVLEQADSRLGLCLDTGHCAYSGVDAQEFAERYATRLEHVHLKDLHQHILRDALDRGMSFEQAVAAGTFCPLGEGSVDLRGFIDTLRAVGYDGWATYEQDRLAAEHPAAREDAERSLAHLRRLGIHDRPRAV